MVQQSFGIRICRDGIQGSDHACPVPSFVFLEPPEHVQTALLVFRVFDLMQCLHYPDAQIFFHGRIVHPAGSSVKRSEVPVLAGTLL